MPETTEKSRELELTEKWRAKAKTIKSLDEFCAFWRELMDETEHDYGTICRAIGALAGAAATAANNHAQGGMTGFQAGCVFWEFYRIWNPGLDGPDDPVRLTNYADLLYPQYEHKFRNISKETWEWLQERVKHEVNAASDAVHPNVLDHWASILAGQVPFGLTVETE